MPNAKSSHALAITGERFHPEMTGEIRQEHMHRYAWCLGLIAGKDVLDIASGEGFGSSMLAEHANSVIGIDISAEAAAHAAATYKKRNLRFIHGDILQIPLPDDSVDVVVCFETIEHVSEQRQAINEITRVLRCDGILIISSPNVDVYTVKQSHHNPYHEKELKKEEFVELLETVFPAVNIYGQRILDVSLILPIESPAREADLFIDDGEIKHGTNELPYTMYFMAVASKVETRIPLLRASFLMSKNYDTYWENKLTYRDKLDTLSADAKAAKRQAEKFKSLIYINGILESGLFDAQHYAKSAGIESEDSLNLVIDYIIRGEEMGFSPSQFFDPLFYKEKNPDVVEVGMNMLVHYIATGQLEGRRPLR